VLPSVVGGRKKGGSAVSEVDATLRMEQHRSTRRRLLNGFSGLARSRALVTADAASCRFANDRDLPEKKLDRPLLHAHPCRQNDRSIESYRWSGGGRRRMRACVPTIGDDDAMRCVLT